MTQTFQVVRTKRQVTSYIFTSFNTRDDAHINWQETHIIPDPDPGRGRALGLFYDPPWLFTARFDVNWGSSRASSTQQQGVKR